jgi:hypothetical protein
VCKKNRWLIRSARKRKRGYSLGRARSRAHDFHASSIASELGNPVRAGGGDADCTADGVGGGGTAKICGVACGGGFGVGLRAGAAAGFGPEILGRESFSAGCRVAMSRAICSWPTTNWFTVCRRSASSRAITSSACCTSGEEAAGAGGAPMSRAVCAADAACGKSGAGS